MRREHAVCMFLVVFFPIACADAIACGEDEELTEYQPLQLILSTDKNSYSVGEVHVFSLRIINVSPDSVCCPADFGSGFLISKERPDGSCVNFGCTSPAPDCGGPSELATIVLGPGEEVEYHRKRPVYLSGEPGPYIWQYTLVMYNCPDTPYSIRVVARTNEVVTGIDR